MNSQGYIYEQGIKMAAFSSKDHPKKDNNNEVSDVSLIGQKLQPNLFKNSAESQNKINALTLLYNIIIFYNL